MATIITPGHNNWDNWEVLQPNDFIYQVQQGRKGKNIGLGNGLNYINNFINGTHKARYYLIGADSGVGKTTLADFMFVLNAYKSAKQLGRPLKIFYCSFEIGKADKIARWVSYYVFKMYKVRLPSDYILGRIKGRLLNEEHTRMVQDAYKFIQQMFDECVVFIDLQLGPTNIFNSIVEGHFEKRGKVVRNKDKNIEGFIPNDPDYMTMLLVDHIALTDEENNEGAKRTMDKLSRKAVVLRNLFQCTSIFIQQFSTDMLAANRTMHTKKADIISIAPTRLDFGDSKATFRDADVVIGAVCPGRDLSTCMGYDLSPGALGTSMILAYIMKNRYGKANKICPLFMDGITGIFADLPFPRTESDDSWYQESQKIEQVCLSFCPQLN